jgi:DNA (cytosine-5)-methyltransferase 1
VSVYYNEIDPFAAAWLRELIEVGLIADGEVDERSIADVAADDVRGFTQCHFFAGIGGWSYALRLAGWPDDRRVWTFSCPCQFKSSASRGRTVARDWWPEQRRLVVAARPDCFFGEQVAAAVEWFDGLCTDVEAMGYEVGSAVLPAVAVGSDHARPRIYFVGHADGNGQSIVSVDAEMDRMSRRRRDAGSVLPTHGLSRDVVARTGFGNAIVPHVAAAFIEAYMSISEETP